MNADSIRELVQTIERLARIAREEAFNLWLQEVTDDELRSLRDETGTLWEAANHARWFTASKSEVRRNVESMNA